MSSKYLLSTGEIDRERLTILSRLYNPGAIRFLKDCGVSPGMTVLEIGCGTGHMACDLAGLVGKKGKVIAIDNSESQLAIAKQTAGERGISNIDFYHCGVLDIDKLDIEYDATYGRWVLEFSENPSEALALMYRYLKPGGLLAYEATNMRQVYFFSLPYNPIVEQVHDYGGKMFEKHHYPSDFAFNGVYPIFLNLSCKDIRCEVNQAMLNTPEEKSVYRLGFISSGPSLLEKGIITEEELNNMQERLEELENSNTITGFYHNILIAGRK